MEKKLMFKLVFIVLLSMIALLATLAQPTPTSGSDINESFPGGFAIAEQYGASPLRQDNQIPIMAALASGMRVKITSRVLTINAPIDAPPYCWLEGSDSKDDKSSSGILNPCTVITLADNSNCPMFRSQTAHVGSGAYSGSAQENGFQYAQVNENHR